MAVQCHDGKFFRIGSKLDTWNVSVFVERQIHFTCNVALDIVCVYTDFRIHFAGFRVFVFVSSRISGILALFGGHTFVPREAEHGNLTLVEADIGNHFAVGTEVESAVERELFFIYPVGDTVQYLIVFTVLCNLRFAVAEKQLHKENIVVAYESNLEAVG